MCSCAQKLIGSQLNLLQGTKKQSSEENWKQKTEMLRRNGPVTKSVESDLRPEESLW